MHFIECRTEEACFGAAPQIFCLFEATTLT
nr:MAG TPA: hypothetical protein [Inoviridae sp.]